MLGVTTKQVYPCSQCFISNGDIFVLRKGIVLSDPQTSSQQLSETAGTPERWNAHTHTYVWKTVIDRKVSDAPAPVLLCKEASKYGGLGGPVLY